MRPVLCLSVLLGLSLAACDREETAAQGTIGTCGCAGVEDAASGRIEAGLVGNWAKTAARFSTDTLIFTDLPPFIRTPSSGRLVS